MSIYFESDGFSNLAKDLKEFASIFPNTVKGLMRPIGRDMVAEARGRARSAFTSRTGNLLRHIKFIPTEKGGMFTTRDKLNEYKSDAYYSLFIEKGANIKPKNKKYLTFKINGEWKKVTAARIRPRPFMGPVFDEYWEGENSKGYKAFADALQKKMKEYLK
jgi:hypothetical protein